MMTETNEQLPAVLTLNNNQLGVTGEFQRTLNQIEEAINHAKNLVSVQTVDKLDEQSLETTISDLQTAQALARNVNNTRKELKRYLRNKSDQVLAQYDALLEKANFSELEKYNAEAKQLKKDLSAYRINQRWNQLKATFDANLTNYPLIHQLAPQLEDFTLFRLRHPKLVTGAKNYKIGDKQISAINHDLYDISQCLQDLKENAVGLTPEYQFSILQSFIKKPEKDYYLEIKNQALVQQKQAIEQQKALEKQRQQQLELQQMQAQLSNNLNELSKQIDVLQNKYNAETNLEQKTQLGKALSQAQQKYVYLQQQMVNNSKKEREKQAEQNKPKEKELSLNEKTLKWLGDYVSINLHKYGNLKGNPIQKTNLIYDLMHSVDNPSSQLYEFLLNNSNNEQTRDELLLSMIGQILNV